MQLDVLNTLEEKIQATLGTIESLRKNKAASQEPQHLSDENRSLLQGKLQDMLLWLDELEDLAKTDGLTDE